MFFKCILLLIIFNFLIVIICEDQRILLMTQVPIEEYPFMVSIQDAETRKQICEGSIIHEQFILTAAHCMIQLNNHPVKYHDLYGIRILAGSGSLDKSATVLHAINFIPHPWYGRYPNILDVGLIQEPIIFTSKIQPILLPEKDDYLVARSMATLLGWELTIHSGTFIERVELNILNNEVCSSIKEFFQFRDTKVSSWQVCAIGIDFDTINSEEHNFIRQETIMVRKPGLCMTTGGGPLIYQKKLHGIYINKLKESCAAHHPIEFIRMTVLRDWIDFHFKYSV